jgi:predicted MPP superfamily phosphohydrolase
MRGELLKKSRDEIADICEIDPRAVKICGDEDFVKEYEALRTHPFKMQYVSDIHLEFFNKNDLKKVIDNFLKAKDADADTQYIALLGDIGDPMAVKNKFYEHLISGLAPHYKGVFVVAGNNEYYSGRPMEDVNRRIEEICGRQGNVHFLNNRKVVIELSKDRKVTIIGSTLWTYIPKDSQEYVKKRISDYGKIYIDEVNRFVPEINNELHDLAVKFIEKELGAAEDVIVLTHHAPLTVGTTNPKYEGDVTNFAYATDLSRLFSAGTPKAWCFGHTHWQVDFEFNGVKILSNPMGYRTELKKNGQDFHFGASLKID